MREPDQIDMLDEHELRTELRATLVDLGRLAKDAATLQSRLDRETTRADSEFQRAEAYKLRMRDLDAELLCYDGDLRKQVKELSSRLHTALGAVRAFLDADRDSDEESAAYDVLVDLVVEKHGDNS